MQSNSGRLRTSKSTTSRARRALGVGGTTWVHAPANWTIPTRGAPTRASRQTRERVRCHRGSARVNGRGAAGRDAYPSLVQVARVLTSISRCICARVPETNAYDRVLAHTRRLRNRALGSPHVALPDSRIVQGCALRVVHVLHPFDPPRHKSSSAHCASSARHALRRTATTRTRLGGGHGVRISTPDLGPALLGRRQMEEKGREKVRTSRADSRLPSRILSFADLDSVVD
jgi:hypothetical protein